MKNTKKLEFRQFQNCCFECVYIYMLKATWTPWDHCWLTYESVDSTMVFATFGSKVTTVQCFCMISEETPLGPLWALLGHSWDSLGSFGALLGDSWGSLGSSLGYLG